SAALSHTSVFFEVSYRLRTRQIFVVGVNSPVPALLQDAGISLDHVGRSVRWKWHAKYLQYRAGCATWLTRRIRGLAAFYSGPLLLSRAVLTIWRVISYAERNFM